jgi:hypothetical protein
MRHGIYRTPPRNTSQHLPISSWRHRHFFSVRSDTFHLLPYTRTARLSLTRRAKEEYYRKVPLFSIGVATFAYPLSLSVYENGLLSGFCGVGGPTAVLALRDGTASS